MTATQCAVLVIACAVLGTAIRLQQYCRINQKHILIDGANQQCCHGLIGRKEINKGCCYKAKKFYNQKDQLCCGKDIFWIRDGKYRGFGCCNETLIDTTTQLCCQKKTYNISEEEKGFAECCGDQKIDNRETICCHSDSSERVTQHARYSNIFCCGELPFNGRNQKCRWNRTGEPKIVAEQEEYCEDKVISLKTHSCCLDKIFNVPGLDPSDMTKQNPKQSCCGKNVMNPLQDKCCPGTHAIVPKTDNVKCCKNAPNGYVTAIEPKQMCCHGEGHVRKSPNDTCCGVHRIDSRNRQCCGWKPFDPQMHQCCGDQVIKPNETCCGRRALQSSQLCCRGTFGVDKTSHDDNSCCFNYFDNKIKTYNDEKQRCTNSGPVALFEGILCEGERHSENEGVCCADTWHAHTSSRKFTCCGSAREAFNSLTQMCCLGVVHNMSRNEGECCEYNAYSFADQNNPCKKRCGNTHFDSQQMQCCGDKVFSLSKDEDGCCDGQAFFTSEQTCCENKLHNVTDGDCCGREILNGRREKCCGSYAVIPKRKRKSPLRCCRNKLVYDRRFGRCEKVGLIKPKKPMSHVQNVCQKKRWENFNNLEAEVCWRKFAIIGRIVGIRRKGKAVRVIMKGVENLARSIANSSYHSFIVSRKSDVLKIYVRLGRRERFGKRQKEDIKDIKNKTVIMFLDKQAKMDKSGRKRKFSLEITEKDGFRVVQATRKSHEKLVAMTNLRICLRALSEMDATDLLNYKETAFS